MTVGGRVHVRAPWHAPVSVDVAPVEIVIDPAQAFGTGAHATTRLCLELLLALPPGGPCVDAGCGSGVLAIAAAKLGWSPVLGIDHDPLAVAATRENAAVNGAAVDVRRHDLLHDGPVPSAPTVLANLLGPLLRRVAADGFAGEVPRALSPAGCSSRRPTRSPRRSPRAG